mgnify:FL=1
MKLLPRNRHLLVEKISETIEEEGSVFILPEGYAAKEAKYELVKIIDFSDDCTLNCYQGAVAVVNGNMVEEVEAGKEKFSLILENYVFGILEGE